MKIFAYEVQILNLLESDIETTGLTEQEIKERLAILSDVVELFFLHLFSSDHNQVAVHSSSLQLEGNIKKYDSTLRGKMIRLALSEPDLINRYNLLNPMRKSGFQGLVKQLLVVDGDQIC